MKTNVNENVMQGKESEVALRTAAASDAEALVGIYAPYVRETAITFEYEVPSVDEFRDRIVRVLSGHPYVVAERGGRIVGYAYASQLKSRAAYRHAVETSIYVERDERGSGVGEALLRELEARLRAQGVVCICACISYTQVSDPYLTNASMRFHERMGYRLAGHLHRCGLKFGRWYDIVWMEKLV